MISAKFYNMLKNPAFNALCTQDAKFNRGSTPVCYYPAEVAPFIGLPSWSEKDQHRLLNCKEADRTWFVMHADEIKFIQEFKIVFTIPLYQLICPALSNTYQPKARLVPLGVEHIDPMIELTQLTKPGPFTKRTIEFGNYLGIFEEDRLVAMGGERMHLDGFTEISAICTHPEYRGQGYGSQIVQALSERILREGQTPFLHVRNDNKTAIGVYQKLGFQIEREMFFAIFRKE